MPATQKNHRSECAYRKEIASSWPHEAGNLVGKTSAYAYLPAAAHGSALRGQRIAALVLGAFLCLASAPSLAAYQVEIQAPPMLKDLLSEYLDVARYRKRTDLSEEQLNFMLADTPEQVARLAATEGYFSPKTTVNVEQGGDAMRVRVTVEAGVRTTVSDVALHVSGAAATRSPEQVERLRQQWPLNAGEPFLQRDWDAAKQAGLQVLQQRRYAAARIRDSEARILADQHQATLSVDYDSGPVFTFGAPRVTGIQRYPESIIRNVNPIVSGEEYSAERLLEFQRQVLQTPYFSNVVIDIERNPAQAQQVPINVQVSEFPTQRIHAGAGYATDTGAHFDGRYSHNDIFGRAWVLNAQTELEQQRQFGALELSMPPRTAGFVNSAHGSIERTTLEGVDLRSRRLGLRRARKSEKKDVAYFIEYYRDRLEQLSGAPLPPDTVVQPGAHQALVLGLDRTRRQVDNLLFPRQGRIVSIQAGAAVKGVLTDQSFLRLYLRLREYLPVGKRDLVVVRAELGGIVSKGGNAAIPASLLFRAGGTDSVRGYAFQSIGNRRDGTVYPTRFLATGSAEYQHWRSERWGGAVFYDVGMASDRWQEQSLFHALGVGIRWHSPVGRINADLAYGFQGNKIRPHFSLGIAF